MIWRDIKNFEGRYKVSNTGLVMSYDSLHPNPLTGGFSLKKGRILKSWAERGYQRVGLSVGNKKHKYIYVHRLVAYAFLESVSGKIFVNHKDGNPLNNNIINLEWCTPKENVSHSIKVLNRQGKNCKPVVCSVSERSFQSIKDAKNQLNLKINITTLRRMVAGKEVNKTSLAYAK